MPRNTVIFVVVVILINRNTGVEFRCLKESGERYERFLKILTMNVMFKSTWVYRVAFCLIEQSNSPPLQTHESEHRKMKVKDE